MDLGPGLDVFMVVMVLGGAMLVATLIVVALAMTVASRTPFRNAVVGQSLLIVVVPSILFSVLALAHSSEAVADAAPWVAALVGCASFGAALARIHAASRDG